MKLFRCKLPWKARQNKSEIWLDPEYKRWFDTQLDAMNRGEEVDPPWIMYPSCNVDDMGPIWGGWRQGDGEIWLLRIWLPFWRKLSQEEKDAYKRKWPLPSADWELYLREKWK